jgi:glycosyltransferase involved in cell wall biosynthesis
VNDWNHSAMNAGEKIIVIAEDLAEPWDEGFKKFAHSLAEVLEKQNDVLVINVDRSGVADERAVRVPATKTFLSEDLHDTIRSFSPRKIIYIPSASTTSASFFRALALRLHARRARIGMVGLQPKQCNRLSRLQAKFVSPHVLFVFSYNTLLSLQRRSIKAVLLPMGVDSSVFRPAQPGEKNELRVRHGIPDNEYVFLHTGCISPSRNIIPLTRLAALPGSLVLVAGSTGAREDTRLCEYLESGGVRITRDTIPIEESYRLSDCYVFPVEDPYACSEIPPGVLEALASGIPVISRPVGGLRDLLPAGEDIIYGRSNEELIHAAKQLQAAGPPKVRRMNEFSWESVADKVLEMLEKPRL